MLQFSPVRSNADTKRYYAGADFAGEKAPDFQAEGKAAERLGLAGEISHAELCSLFDKLHPRTGEKLYQRKVDDAIACHDATFSPPKSFAIMAQVAGDERLLGLHAEAVSRVLLEMESRVQVRERKGTLWNTKAARSVGNMLAVQTHHLYTRPVEGVPDPGMHTHALIFNIAHDGRGWKAAELVDVVKSAPLWRAMYHAELAAGARRLGYETRPTKDAFEIAGVADATIRKFSRRSELIELEAKRREVKSPKGKAALGALTREKKLEVVAPEKLHAAWERRLTPTERAALAETHRKAVEGREGEWADRSTSHLRNTLHGLLRAESAVPEEKLLTEALKRGVGEVSLAGLQTALQGPGLVRGKADGVSYVTTPEAMEQEAAVLTFARCGAMTLRRVKRGEKVEGMERLPGFEALRERVSQAADSGERLRFYVPGYRLYTDKAQRGSPAVWLEDFAGLKTGQMRPKVKLARKVAKVSRKLAAKLKRQVTRVKQFEAVRSMVERQLDGRARDVARGYER